jgi:hypothetical protein
MRLKDILEAAMPFNAPITTTGLTFGFEAELVALAADHAQEVDLYDMDNLCEELGYDESKFDEEFEEWKEENDKEDAEPADWINAIGEATWWELIDPHGNWQYGLSTEGYIVRFDSWEGTMDNVGEDLGEFTGQRVNVARNSETPFDNKGKYRDWFIEADPSIMTPNEVDHGFEVVSPVFHDYEQFSSTLTSFLAWVQEQGFLTNGSTGLHINIGDSKHAIDPLKLLLFTGESWVKTQWGRQNNPHTNSLMPTVGQLPASIDAAREIVKSFITDLNEKHFVVNLKTLMERGYVEFRPIGNSGYETKIDQILTHVNRFVQVMAIAADANKYRKEYARKLGMLIGGAPTQQKIELGVDVRLVMKWMDTIRFSERDRAKIVQDGKLIITGDTLLAIVGYTEGSDERIPDVVLRTLAKHCDDLAELYPAYRQKILARTPWNMDEDSVAAVIKRIDALLNYHPPA